ncbi:hypothetical protein OG204_19825 [Streptomyces sp. NBC_01387]|uniref:hypothetical protein n=1 Tax=unclassified Streptomyces TaxID=2593676 RepID=UPI002253D521|nr:MULTISPECIES: hypothetical protein [unclassified Streptomyces]MCX4549413.1 hypothetical protein [Streptomyces sp. NBC_01500]WSC20948.1 hypothetical protein OIE60_15385 [Streptomyces sp. NBC_01766]WSV54955.1 hypothetical protein OG282_15325 [Streptomyces sp. NBC_01014]
MGITSPKARAALAIVLGAFCQGQLATGAAWADAPDGGMETHHGPSLITIDNSNADSWLEVDRTLNILGPFSKGTAGSDHDGGGGAIEQTVTGSQNGGVQAAPNERGDDEGDEKKNEGTTEPGGGTKSGGAKSGSAATGGDDDEGDADHDATCRRHGKEANTACRTSR